MRALFTIAITILGVVLSSKAGTNSTNLTDEQLVSQLVDIAAPTVGLDPTASVRVFIAENEQPEFAGGVIGSVRPKVYPAMQELVRRGVSALPTLIKHLDDKRPTKLKVGGGFFTFRYFSDEYDPKTRPQKVNEHPLERDFTGDYTVKVGDVCYVLIGQIVNRNLCAVRYQPSMGLVINSPIEASVLIADVKKDWGGISAHAHMESLLADARRGKRLWSFGPADARARTDNRWWSYGPALERLRFYYPDEYRREAFGELKAKIADFESKEKSQSK